MIIETPSGLIEVPLSGPQPYIQLTRRGEPQTFRSFDVARLPDYEQAIMGPEGFRPVQFGGPPNMTAVAPTVPSPGAGSVPAQMRGARNLSQIVADGRQSVGTPTPAPPRSAIESINSMTDPFAPPGGAPDSPGIDTATTDDFGTFAGNIASFMNPMTALPVLAAQMVVSKEQQQQMPAKIGVRSLVDQLTDPATPQSPTAQANPGTAGTEAFGATVPDIGPTDPAFGPQSTNPTANVNVGTQGQEAFGQSAPPGPQSVGPSGSAGSGSPASPTASANPGTAGVGAFGATVPDINTNDPAFGPQSTNPTVSVNPGGDGDGTGGGVGAASPSGGGGGPGTSGGPGTAGSDPGGSVGGPAGPGGDGGGGGGSKYICGALHDRGLLPSDIYLKDLAYGDDIRARDPLVHAGYRVWGPAVASLIRRDDWIGDVVTRLAAGPALAWARQMAHDMDDHVPPALWGKAVMAIAYPTCRALGWLATLTEPRIRTT